MKIIKMIAGFQELPGRCTLNIYTVGCTIRCPGCHNSALQDFHNPDAYEINIQDVLDRIKYGVDFYDGVCWLGGEPTDQPDLPEFMRAIKANLPNIIQVLYTGRWLEQLPKTILDQADLIIDGPWCGNAVGTAGSIQRVFKRDKGVLNQILWSQVSKEF